MKPLYDALGHKKRPWWRVWQPHIVIHRDGQPMLRRWHLLPRSRLFGLYLHNFVLGDDDRAMHDHPANHWSFLISGNYYDVSPAGKVFVPRFHPWYRRAEDPHRVELIDGQPVWSLLFIGRRRRDWGFHCPQGWRRWQDYLVVWDGGNSMGRGCD